MQYIAGPDTTVVDFIKIIKQYLSYLYSSQEDMQLLCVFKHVFLMLIYRFFSWLIVTF